MRELLSETKSIKLTRKPAPSGPWQFDSDQRVNQGGVCEHRRVRQRLDRLRRANA